MKTISTFSVIFLSGGIALSSATQLRIPGAPYGAGELLMIVGAFGLVVTVLAGTPLERAPLLAAFCGFWLVALVALTAGALSLAPDTLFNDIEFRAFFHDTRAFLFVAIILFALLAPTGAEARVRRMTTLVLAFSIVPLFALWLIAQRTSSVGPLNLWYGPRFLGWTQNPNQLALVVVTAPFVALELAARARRPARRLAALFVAVAAAVLGIASESDALALSWVGAATLVIIGSWGRLAARGRRAGIPGAVAYIVTPAIALLITLWAGPSLQRRVVAAFERTASEGGQGSTRRVLWERGVRSYLSAPVVGLGPGAHAGDPRARGEEAHNTLIDWACSTGTVGVAAWLGLLAWVGVMAWRARSPLLLGALAALVCFSMFHYVLRHPIYWQQLLAVTALAMHRVPVPMTRAAAPALRRAAFTTRRSAFARAMAEE